MLIPADHPIDWKKPPVVTLMLIAISLLVFFTYQWNDKSEIDAANQFYQQRLLALEWPYYETHLLKQNQKALFEKLEASRKTGDLESVVEQIGSDRRFGESLVEDGKNFMDTATYGKWLEARDTFNQMRDSESRFAFGLDPQRSRPITYVTSLFLTPDLLLLVMNAALLLTLGLALEPALGGGRMLTGFILAGILGGMVHQLMASKGVFPLTGSSAALAGLAGMFAAKYRFGPMKFSYGVGTFTASAVVVLVLFAGKEAAEWALSLFPPMDFAAHITGLATGALFMVIADKWFPKLAETDLPEEEEATDEELAFREELNKALEAIANLNFPEAQRRLLELSKQRPSDTRVLFQLYHLLKLSPQTPQYDKIARHLLSLPATDDASMRQSLNLYRDYDRLSHDKGALDLETSLKLVMKFARLQEVKEAEKLFKHAQEFRQTHILMPKAAQSIAQAFESLQDPARAEHYKQFSAVS